MTQSNESDVVDTTLEEENEANLSIKKPINRTILAFDFGTRSIGVAVGNEFTQTAKSLPAIRANDGIPNQQELAKVINDWQPQLIVVGLPLNMDGTYQDVTYRAKKFGNRINANFKIPVYFKDERLSTKEAKEYLFDKGGRRALKKGEVDSLSAQIILEGFFTEQLD